MKNNDVKSFVFQVAQQSEKQEQWKAADSSAQACAHTSGQVACGGCTLVEYPWGREPMTNMGNPLWGGTDGAVWC